MPHTAQSARQSPANFPPKSGAPRGNSPGQVAARARAKATGSSAFHKSQGMPVYPGVQLQKGGPRIIAWASPQQKECFEYGPAPICASGGYGCVAAGTLIYDAERDEHVEVQKIDWEPLVLAWDGVRFVEQRATRPFLKGHAPLFEVRTARGRRIVVTDEHRFLTLDGWEPFSALRAEHAASKRVPLLASDGILLPSIWGVCPSTHVSDGRRSTGTVQGCPGGCSRCRCLCGEPLPPVGETAPVSSPSQGGAQTQHQPVLPESFVRTGGLGHTPRCTQTYPISDLLSRRGSLPPSSLRAEQGELRAFEELDEPARFEPSGLGREGSPLNQAPASQDDEFASGRGGAMIGAGVSSLDYIVEVGALGEGDFYDLHVPVYENYLAEGLINHNSGKTYAFCLKAMYISATYDRNRGLISRLRWNKLQMTTLKTFFKVCPPEAYAMGRRSDVGKSLTLNNGSEIIWSQLDDSEIMETIQGLEINWFMIDQAEDVSEEIFDVLLRRLGRWDQAIVPQHLIDAEHAAGREWPWRNDETGQYIPPTYALATCNPSHELHWIYRRFHEESREWKSKYRKMGYKIIHMNSMDNKFLPQQNRAALMEGTKEFIARFVEGKWGVPEGQIHKVTPESLLKMTPALREHLRSCVRYRAMDHGETAPTCVLWFAVDADSNIFVYQEYYQEDRLISYHREEIYKMSLVATGEGDTLDQYSRNLADPSIFSRGMQKDGVKWSVAEEYRAVKDDRANSHDAIWWDRGDNDELGTRNRINEYLKLDEKHKHPVTGELGAPYLYFVEQTPTYPRGCYEVIRQIRAQRRVKIGTKDGHDMFSDDRDTNIIDHGYDPLRYLIADQPGLPGSAQRPVNPNTVAAALTKNRLRARLEIKKRRVQSTRTSELARRATLGFLNRRR